MSDEQRPRMLLEQLTPAEARVVATLARVEPGLLAEVPSVPAPFSVGQATEAVLLHQLAFVRRVTCAPNQQPLPLDYAETWYEIEEAKAAGDSRHATRYAHSREEVASRIGRLAAFLRAAYLSPGSAVPLSPTTLLTRIARELEALRTATLAEAR